jgi:hypothetical protein
MKHIETFLVTQLIHEYEFNVIACSVKNFFHVKIDHMKFCEFLD